jgi:hypothetical protein
MTVFLLTAGFILDYGACRGFVITAATEAEARTIAATDSEDTRWLDPAKASCEIVALDSSRIVMRDWVDG